MEKSPSDKSNQKHIKESNTSEVQDVMVIFERVNPFVGIIYDEQQDVEMEE